MRPLKLTMQAFGPYANKQEVDFQKLEDKTMFVISGATGAGKTTIFDGISFAIYGKASGDDRIGTELRSQFALDDTLTEVSLMFELRGKRYLIKRTPQQEKKKARGEGTTIQGAKAELYELGSEEKILASSVREVDEKIEEIIKIDCHQFRQIMMIPQGEFRKLLISDSKDKEKILQRLFHTEHYKIIEELLKEKASQLRKSVEQRLLERNSYISRIQGEGSEQLKAIQESDHINVNELLVSLAELVKQEEETLLLLADEIAIKEQTRQQIQKEIHHGNYLVEQFETKEKLFSQKEKLEAETPFIEKKVEAIKLANKANIIKQYEDNCLEIDQQVVLKEQELNNAKTLFGNLNNVLKEKQALLSKEEGKTSERDACQKEINRLQTLESDVLSFSNLEKEVVDLGAVIEKLRSRKLNLEESASTIEEKLVGLHKQKENLNEAKLRQADITVKLSTEKNSLEKITNLLKGKKKLISLEKQFSATEDDRQDIEEALKEKNQQVELILEAWNKGQAGLLAKKLSDDNPCPVCGALHHPDKAVLHDDVPTQEHVKDIQKELKELEQQKQKIDAAYYEAKSQFETQMDQVIQLADEVSMQLPHQLRSYALEDIEEHFQAQGLKLTEELQQLEKLIAGSEQLENEINSRSDQQRELKELLKACNEDYENKWTKFVEKRRDLTRLSETLPDELRNEATFRKKLALEESKLKAYEEALQVAQKAVNETRQEIASVEGGISSLQKVTSELKARQKEYLIAFQAKLQDLGFTSIEQYNKVKLPQVEIEKMEQNVQAFREELRSVWDRHQELVSKLEKVERPDIELLNEKLKAQNSEVELLQENKNVLYHKVKTNSSIIDAIKKINKDMATVEEEYKIVGELSDIASGKNTYRVTFERYVLAAFLDQILLAANGRLNKMTSGRYQLQRKTERSKGNIQSGLELLVYDQYTGGTRHVKTLSGGESFKASLALALGLADIVQSFSGGISMETMFIDEGFGTLDPESLENAIETLIDIQSTGRLVGIISHVPELKERIDARFEVTSTQSGSIVRFFEDTVSV